MKKYSKKERNSLEKHCVMQNHERGDFMGNLINLLDRRKNDSSSKNDLITEIYEIYIEFLREEQLNSKSYAKKYLFNVFQNKEYFNIHPLLFDKINAEVVSELGGITGTFNRVCALNRLKQYQDDNGVDLGL